MREKGYEGDFWLPRHLTTAQELLQRFQWKEKSVPVIPHEKDVGAFSNQGKVPQFTDSRFRFIKGMIEDTLLNFKFEREDGETLLIFFDLDIFEPNLFAFNKLSPFLKQSDILYFDESFDIDERIVIQQYLLKTFDLTLLGYTPLSTAFRIDKKNS
jgi:hypothetical protein